MSFSDIFIIFQWWIMLFVIGTAFLPLTSLIFPNFIDRGYIFARIMGIVIVSYCVFILGFLKILPFTQTTIFIAVALFAGINILIFRKKLKSAIQQFNNETIKIIIFEEILFFVILLFWSFIHAHQPDIHGLEKYMDFGFINSILRTDYFPPKDMWFTPFPINYYYFGHLVTAVLTKLSNIPSSTTFNLMLSTISALGFVSAFSIGGNLINSLMNRGRVAKEEGRPDSAQRREHWREGLLLTGPVFAGLLTAFILNFAGNLHSIYLFFKPYTNENPVPFWNLIFSPLTFPNNYWYPNATRFIENTIHEFPIYSSVVSDLHGHFLDLPLVLLTIALLMSMFFRFNNHSQIKNSKLKIQNDNSKFKIFNFKLQLLTFEFSLLTLLAFLLAIMYMANAWDGIIYFLLSVIIIGFLIYKQIRTSKLIQNSKLLNFPISSLIFHLSFLILVLGVGFFLFSLPFNINFKPFASGIGILCAPKVLTDIGRFGPFLFEPNHCQHSPIWQLFILYGFFYFWIVSFLVFLKLNAKRYTLNASDIFVGILIILSTILIILPEFIYVKDIYPAHYRANTMFKLSYQSFIMLSLSSGYIIFRLISNWKLEIGNWKFGYWVIGSICLLVVFLYPYFAINSYFGNLKAYSGLDGTNYLKPLYPQDYEAILWINKNIKGQPVALEAQGDSYTDYARVSVNTGLPTVLGWTVHEWLWRGTYDIPAPRIEEVKNLYELKDLNITKQLIQKYNIALVFVGELERQKYTSLNEEKFSKLGKIIYQNNQTKIYKIN